MHVRGSPPMLGVILVTSIWPPIHQQWEISPVEDKVASNKNQFGLRVDFGRLVVLSDE